jgi:hypothetical protein
MRHHWTGPTRCGLRETACVALATVALAGCATYPPNSALATGQAFRGDDVDNFNVRDERTLYVSSRQGFVFRLDTNEDCYEIGTEAVSVSPFRGGDPRMMIGDQAVVTVLRTRDLPVSCIATVSGPITDSRASGLRSRTPGQ